MATKKKTTTRKAPAKKAPARKKAAAKKTDEAGDEFVSRKATGNKRCPHCRAEQIKKAEPDENGWKIHIVGSTSKFMIKCCCGAVTKLFNTKHELLHFWNTRNGKAPDTPGIEVKHGPGRAKGKFVDMKEAEGKLVDDWRDD